MAFRDDLKAAMTRAEQAEADLRNAEERAESDQELIAQLNKELGESRALLQKVHARLENQRPAPVAPPTNNKAARLILVGVIFLFIAGGALAGALYFQMRVSSTESATIAELPSVPKPELFPPPAPAEPPPPPEKRPEPEPPPPPPTEEVAPQTICDSNHLDCYAEHDAFGAVSGRVEVRLAEDGSVTRARFVSGDTPRAVRRCIVSVMEERTVAGFEGGAAKVTCTWSGQLMGSSMMMQFDSDFERL